ncbi:hypothetical protein [Butyrivibrio sp. MC2013]|uniref:hypothetical protein n=1 Tax=Butyrivibrio sp. MC2013 TaxID=1280686 RepID=UPI00047A94F7|nr:hypothetical protein [Butyrivibrio sp. MC2013]
MEDLKTIIDFLQSECTCYIVDFLPRKMSGSQFFELEDYLLKTYIEDFAAKISSIVIRLIHYYPSKIFIVEPSKKDDTFYKDYLDKDLRDEPLSEIDEIIRHTIIYDVSSLQILIKDSDKLSLMSINGGFSVDFYSGSSEVLELAMLLVDNENLYVRKADVS